MDIKPVPEQTGTLVAPSSSGASFIDRILPARMKSFWTAFEESDGAWSWSRVFGSLTCLSAIYCLIYLTHTNKALPPAAQLLSLGTWAAFPYAVRKIAEAWGKNTN